MRRGIKPGDIRVRPRVVRVVDVWMDYDPGMGHYRPRVALTSYFMYEPRPICDQTKRPCFFFRLKRKPESLNWHILKCCRVQVLYLQEV